MDSMSTSELFVSAIHSLSEATVSPAQQEVAKMILYDAYCATSAKVRDERNREFMEVARLYAKQSGPTLDRSLTFNWTTPQGETHERVAVLSATQPVFAGRDRCNVELGLGLDNAPAYVSRVNVICLMNSLGTMTLVCPGSHHKMEWLSGNATTGGPFTDFAGRKAHTVITTTTQTGVWVVRIGELKVSILVE